MLEWHHWRTTLSVFHHSRLFHHLDNHTWSAVSPVLIFYSTVCPPSHTSVAGWAGLGCIWNWTLCHRLSASGGLCAPEADGSVDRIVRRSGYRRCLIFVSIWPLRTVRLWSSSSSGRSGIVVTRLPAAREGPGSNRAAGKSLCFHENHCDTQLWARAAQWLQCLG